MSTTHEGPPRTRAAAPCLHDISLTTKEDWARFVNAPRRTQPDTLSRKELTALSTKAAKDYDKRRRDWHANMGIFKTPMYEALHEELLDIVDSNQQDGNQAKGAIAVDSPAGLGKTTTLQQFAKKLQLQLIADEGDRTDKGHQRLPVCWVSLTGNPTMRDVNRSMLGFFAHPGNAGGTATQFIRRALDCVLSCDVKLLVIDDLHFLRWPSANSVEVSNHFKFIANMFPVTVVFLGVGLAKGGLLDENNCERDVLAQTLRRTTPLGLAPYHLHNDAGRQDWRALLKSIEQRLVLAGTDRGMVADSLSDYLWGRTTGHIGSLTTLINRGCLRAIRTGAEELTEDILNKVKLDAAAEAARPEAEARLRSHNLTTRLQRDDADTADPG